MTPPAWHWLPPLNSHENSLIDVRIRESTKRDNFHAKRKFRITLTVDVDFYSETDVSTNTPFKGLSLSKSQLFDATNSETLAASLRQSFIDFIPFPLDSCLWTENRPRPSPPVYISGDDDLVQRISDFVFFISGNSDNRELMLAITKSVVVPAEEFDSWVSWYEEKKRVHRGFEAEFRKAITRPREATELYDETMSLVAGTWSVEVCDGDSGGGGCCVICLEEFGGGVGVAQLPCRHRFHQDCVVRWLKGNHVCPLCRHQLPLDY
ncbi:RING/U-box superfamily protein [Perilla frutescens var. hirtella]|uniref:RING-type E3 ubiquitin transferase n=1 Tax=Perilla frutescens var. hirtella TaxID=608512 RepID=A0AAD4JIU2_PERFH|nr:RING/U-box superfamily protein [Perilla frutescens var. hirtella]